MPDTPLDRLSAEGQSVWLDSISRQALRSGELAGMVRDDDVVGVTSNPTIFQKAMAEGDAYDDQLREVLENERDPKEIFYALAHADITEGCDLLRPVWDEGDGLDGYISWEVDPRFANDTQATIDEAKRLHEWVDRPNLLVKIPATKEGLPAIEESIAKGRAINVTLIFGLERYREVAEAYLRGLERLVEGGGDPSKIASVASFFVSRVDTEADKRLEKLGNKELQGKLAIANAKLAYEAYKEIFAGDRWEALKAKGASPQRCLWASTSTKNPAYRDVIYVEELIGPETVNTMPIQTVKDFQDHGRVERTIDKDVDAAHQVFKDLEAAGVDYEDVTNTLELEGVEKFKDSMHELLAGIEAKRDSMVAA
ncbi:transaldolase [Capillimicrobium parvum]|uniref:Transaldolase n=1 Tax=Capillimicrobium parvum TaxID=2884022 RepID=A0A9E6Y0L3_9ACTN|nr:transaldolase [Capillimicrobium parvum]UGS37940.1 Transaldolase [Capillimicrobium parvum]